MYSIMKRRAGRPLTGAAEHVAVLVTYALPTEEAHLFAMTPPTTSTTMNSSARTSAMMSLR